MDEINYINLYEVFDNESDMLYHKQDSHWNNMGAAIVQQNILDNIGKEYVPFSHGEYYYVDDYIGDLDESLHPLTSYPEKEYVFDRMFTFKYGEGLKDVTEVNIYTTNESKKGSVLMFRDSFGNTLIPFMAEEFAKGYFTKNVPYRMDLVKEYDLCVLEIVERNLDTFQKSAPIMDAPYRTLEGNVDKYNSDKITINLSQCGKYTKISGVLDQNYVDDDSYIYIMLSNDSTTYIYEAFPLYEQDISNVTCDYGYVLYLDYNNILHGEYEVSIITQKNDIDMVSQSIYKLNAIGK